MIPIKTDPSDFFLDGWDIYRSDNVAIIDSDINNDDDCVCTYHSFYINIGSDRAFE